MNRALVAIVALSALSECALSKSWAIESPGSTIQGLVQKEDQQPAAKEKKAEKPKSGYLTSLLPGEETLDPFVPAEPLTTDDAKAIEARTLVVLGFAEEERRHLVSALELYEKAAKLWPESVSALRNAARMSFLLEQHDKGLEYARRALDRYPSDFVLLHEFGKHSASAGRREDAIESFEKASAIEGAAKSDPMRFLELQLLLAQLYEGTGNNEGVANAWSQVLNILDDPIRYPLEPTVRQRMLRRRVTYFERLARALNDQGKHEEALAVLEEGRQKIGGQARRLLLIESEVRVEQGKLEDALRLVEEYLAFKFQNPEALAHYEKVLAKLGRDKDLLAELEKLVERDRHNAELRQFYARKLIEAERFADAEEILRRPGTRSESLPLLFELYRKNDQPEKVLDVILEAFAGRSRFATRESRVATLAKIAEQLKEMSKDSDFVTKVADAARARVKDEDDPLGFRGKLIIADTAKQADLIDLSKEFYALALEDEPNNADVRIQLIAMLMNKELYEDVIKQAQEGAKQHPDDYRFVDRQASALQMLEKTDEAVALIEDYLNRVKKKDSTILVFDTLIRIYQMAERYDDAIKTCQRVINDFPDPKQSGLASYRMANCYLLKGDEEKAEESLVKLADAEPNTLLPFIEAAVNNDLGYIWADKGKHLDRAEEMVRRAIDIYERSGEGPNAAYLDSMGWVYFKKGNYKQALKYLKEASEMEEGQDAVIYDHLGDAHLQLKQRDDAKTAWEKAIKLYEEKDAERDADKLKALREKLKLLGQKDDASPGSAEKTSP
ncbi:tetratricopeptide repeat protein [Kolteria novifilia]